MAELGHMIMILMILLVMILSEVFANDQTSCMTDFEDGEALHFVCFCNNNDQDVQGRELL